MALSKNAIDLLKIRYCHKGEEPKDVYKRVANALSLGDGKFEKKLYRTMLDGYFLPASPTLRNAGIKKTLLHPCHVLPIEDNIESIFDTIKNTATIFHYGGGVGYNFSKLRPKGASLSTGGTSSGIVSFLEIFDKLTEIVKQGGFRRGASLSVLDFNHPEVIEFVRSKLSNKLTNFNISVLVNNEFMKKIDTDEKINLIFNKEVWNSIKIKDLFDLICFSAWNTGDPGLLFYDRINKDNKLFPKIEIKACNPCFTADTLIDSPYGQIAIEKLIGQTLPVYCYDGKKINIGWMKNIRKTGKKQEIWEITLDNNKKIKATSNHKFMLRDGTYKELKDLKVGESLMPFKRVKRNSKGYNQIVLNNGTSIGEAQLVAEWKYGRKLKKEECTHHKDENKQNNSPENIEIKNFGKHSSEHVQGDKNPSIRFPERNIFNNLEWQKQIREKYHIGVKRSKETCKKISAALIKHGKYSKYHNHKIKKIKFYGYEDVYDGEVEKYHNFALAAGIIVHNCGEVPLFEWTCCNLGAVNLSKFVNKEKFNFKKFRNVIELGIRTLRNINSIGWYPFPEMTKQMKELDPCGLGFMGFADCLIKLGIYYNSENALKFIDEIAKPYVEITNRVAKDSFYKRSQQPTGSLSILADCAAGIEPVFERTFERHLTIGILEETRKSYGSKYCKTAHEISSEWHLKIQAKFQEYIDAGVSKTINLPNNASVDDIKFIYKRAHELEVKGITVFRDGSKEGVLKAKSSTKCNDETCHL